MNTGLQDAYNLCWKLAFYIKGMVSEKILDTYNEERLPVAQMLVKTTDKGFGIMVSKNPVISWFLLHVFPRLAQIITSFKAVRSFAVRNVSQVRISYKDRSLSKGQIGSITSGDRFPYFISKQDGKLINVYSLFSNTKFTILLFNTVITGLVNSDLYEVVTLEDNRENRKQIKAVGMSQSFCCVIRPDNYIGYISRKTTEEDLTAYFSAI
jgi:hypothetical protein